MIDSPLFTFCQTEVDSPEHLFFHCDITKSFWQLLCSWISEQKVISTSLTLENVIFGVLNIVEDFHILNHIILLAQYYDNAKELLKHSCCKIGQSKFKFCANTSDEEY